MLLLFLLLIAVFVAKVFDLSIDKVHTAYSTQYYLWYNVWVDGLIQRKYIKLFELYD